MLLGSGIQRIARIVTLVAIPAALAATPSGRKPSTRFTNVPAQAARFIGYSSSIELAPSQKALRDRALETIPAACCSKFTAATCCCPCNLAKTVWGLANHMIVDEKADAAQVRDAAREWIASINPKGFTGDVCDSPGGCARRLSANGCGGMNANDASAAR
jgi:hypothetical protein